MIKKSLIVFATLLLIISFVSAVEVQMNSEFQQGETLIAKFSGNFIDKINDDNVYFYKEHVRIPLEFSLLEIQEDYYIYAQLYGKEEGNYSIKIKNVEYYKGLEITDDEIGANFSIAEGTADFSVSPGALITKEDFELELQNLKDFQIEIALNQKSSGGFFASLFGGATSTSDDTIILKSGEKKSAKFNISEQTGLTKLNLSTENTTYQIPVYMIMENETEEEGSKKLIFETADLEITLATNSNTTRYIYIKNTGEENLENISVELSDSLKDYINLSTEFFEEIEANETEKLELKINSGDAEETVSGNLNLKKDLVLYDELEISLNFIKDFIPADNETEEKEVQTSKTCAELGGEICNSTLKCTEKLVNAKDNKCCLAKCVEKETNNSGKVLGWLILGGIGLFMVWFFLFKFRKTRKKINLLEIAKGKR